MNQARHSLLATRSSVGTKIIRLGIRKMSIPGMGPRGIMLLSRVNLQGRPSVGLAHQLTIEEAFLQCLGDALHVALLDYL